MFHKFLNTISKNKNKWKFKFNTSFLTRYTVRISKNIAINLNLSKQKHSDHAYLILHNFLACFHSQFLKILNSNNVYDRWKFRVRWNDDKPSSGQVIDPKTTTISSRICSFQREGFTCFQGVTLPTATNPCYSAVTLEPVDIKKCFPFKAVYLLRSGSVSVYMCECSGGFITEFDFRTNSSGSY